MRPLAISCLLLLLLVPRSSAQAADATGTAPIPSTTTVVTVLERRLPPVPWLPGDGTATAPDDPLESRSQPVAAPSCSPAVAIDERSILDRVESLVRENRLRPAFESLLDAPRPRLVIRRFHGPERLIMDRIAGFYYSAFQDDVKARTDRSTESMAAIERSVQRLCDADADLAAGGRWWERSWLESRLPADGGAPAEATVVDEGRELEVVKWGELTLTNEGKMRCSDTFDLFFGPRTEVVLDPSARWGARVELRPQRRADEIGDGDTSDATVELERALRGTPRAWSPGVGRAGMRPHGNLLTTRCWTIDWKPRLNFGVPHKALYGALQCAEVELDVTFHPSQSAARWRIAIVRATALPDQNAAQLFVGTEIVGW